MKKFWIILVMAYGLWPMALSAQEGTFRRDLCTSITAPVTNKTFCFEQTGVDAGSLKVWDGASWVKLTGTSSAGDITGVTAGSGLTGGGTTGAVTLDAGVTAPITVSADAIACPTCTTSAAPLTANAPVIGAGGQAVSVGTRSGTTTEYPTVSGAKTPGKQVAFDASGNLIATGTDIGGAGGNLAVQEEDGTPNVSTVTRMRFPNGSLSENGPGDVSVAAGGGVTGGVPTVFNVRDAAYGATGDGVTDDTAALQAAVTAAVAAGGGIIYFPQGTYRTTSAVVLDSNISVVCAGWNSVIAKDGNFSALTATGTSGAHKANVEVKNCKILGENSKPASIVAGDLGIEFRYVDKVRISNNWFDANGAESAMVLGTSTISDANSDIWIVDNVVTNGWIGLNFNGLGNRGHIDRNVVYNNGAIGIEAAGNATISGNIITETTTTGILIAGLSSANFSEGMDVSGNTVVNGVKGIHAVLGFRKGRISGNTIYTNTPVAGSLGIILDGNNVSTNAANTVQVSNNAIYDVAQQGIYITNAFSDLAITGNYIGKKTGANFTGVLIDGASERVAIFGNTFANILTGISATGGSTTVSIGRNAHFGATNPVSRSVVTNTGYVSEQHLDGKPWTLAFTTANPSAAAVTYDAATNNTFTTFLNQNVTAITLSNPSQGQEITIIFSQDGTGGWTVAGWPSPLDVSGINIRPAAGNTTAVRLLYTGSAWRFVSSSSDNVTTAKALNDTDVGLKRSAPGLLSVTDGGAGTGGLSADSFIGNVTGNINSTVSNSLANAARFGDATNQICIYRDPALGLRVEPCTAANIRQTIQAGKTGGVSSDDTSGDLLVIDPIAGTHTYTAGQKVVYEGATDNAFETTFVITDPTADRNFTVPDADSVAVQPDAGAADNFLTGISALGVVSKAQPAFSNLSGAATDAQIPDLNTLSTGLTASRCVETNGSGLLVSAAGACGVGGSGLTSLGGQTGTTQTVTRGVGIGGTSATDDHSFTFDSSELAGLTWGDGSQASIVHSFNLTAGDPAVTYGNGVVNVSTGNLQEGGNDVLTTAAGEINALTAKTTPTTSDLLMIEDAAASNAKKKSTVDQVLAAGDARTATLTNKTLTTPTIASFTNAAHDHSNAAGGGALAAKYATKSITFRIGSDDPTATPLADTADQATMWRNNIAAMTITEVWCESDAGSPIVNLQRDDGTPANVLSSNLTCTTSGATGTIDTAEDNVAVGEKIDFLMVTAGGTAKRVTVSIKATLD